MITKKTTNISPLQVLDMFGGIDRVRKLDSFFGISCELSVLICSLVQAYMHSRMVQADVLVVQLR